MYEYLLETKPFDALELVGGLNREENQIQISLWQEMRGRGIFVPITGSSDSHGTVNGEHFNRSKMLAFSESCSRDALLEAVREGRTAALEQYAGEAIPRIYGLHRYVAFAQFLLSDYFPLHDELCFEEGRLMKSYSSGDEDARGMLKILHGRCEKLLKKYWSRDG
ncbi:hypothetical protein FACS189445_5100 [Spirochaetia bacterium]|nr:hypothetical protein FACS189445_5100 [Spirochaetia bacterium]